MNDPFIIVNGAIRYSCSNKEQMEVRLRNLADMGIKKVILYRAEEINLKELKK